MFTINWAGMKSIKTTIKDPKEIITFEWEIETEKVNRQSQIKQAIKNQNKVKRRFNIITGYN